MLLVAVQNRMFGAGGHTAGAAAPFVGRLAACRLLVAQTERDLVGRSELDPRQRGQRGHQVCPPAAVIEHNLTGGNVHRESGKALDGRRRLIKIGEISCF